MSDAPHSHEDPLHSRRTWLTRAAQLSVAASLPRWAWSKPTALQHDPFSLGVASGDPEPDGFVLWTRLFPLSAADSHPTARALTVRWEVAHDAYFRQIVAKGDALADPAFAHSIHVEVQGLQPNRWYFYRFLLGDAVSAVARTRTAPAPNEMPQRLRAIYASCQRWEHGFYSAWRHACNDAPDLVLFLGDYIYEYATPAETQGLARTHTLPHARTLSDFRNRYALHKSDPDLQSAHAVAPWIVTWDDHEVQNDYTGNYGRDGMSADYLLTRTAAWQAFYEHMPLRVSALKADVFHHLQLYRRIPWGQLARLHILDSRQYRDRQACRAPGSSSASAVQPGQCAELSDPSRSYLGMEQEQWLQQGLAADARHGAPRWSVVAQQTLFSPRRYPSGVQSTDSWDGYPAARDRLVRAIAKGPPRNTVFLGGDIHQNYVCNVDAANARPIDGRASRIIASEFCGTSISSRSGTTQKKVDAIQRHNPHVLLARCEERGYGVCDITPRHWTTSLRAIDHPMDPHSSAHELARFVVEDQRPGPVRS